MPTGRVFPANFDNLIQFKSLEAYNDAHPDELHREWMKKHRPLGHK